MANGAFLGGVVKGQESFERAQAVKDELALRERSLLQEADLQNRGLALKERGLDLTSRGLDIKESALQTERDLAFQERAGKNIADTMTIITEVVKQGVDAGMTADKILAGVEPLVKDIEDIAPVAGRDPKRFRTQVEILARAPTPAQIAATKGTSAAVQKASEATTLEAAGVPAAQARETAGIKAPTNVQIRTFAMRNGDIRSVRADDAAGIAQALAEDGIETNVSVQATSLSGVQRTTTPTKEDIADTREAVQRINSDLEELNRAADLFAQTPEAGGVIGTMIEKGGGLVEQIPFGIGEQITGAAGIDTAAVAETRTQMRVTTSRLLSMITSEEHGRFTGDERKLAERTVAALDVTASPKQIESAMNTAINIMQRAQTREVDKLRIASDISDDDMRTSSGIERMGEVLKKNSFTDEQALRALESLIARMGISAEDIVDDGANSFPESPR